MTLHSTLLNLALGSEAQLKLPDLRTESFLGGVNGHNLLLVGILVSALGLLFGLVVARQLKALAVHRSMLEISELIYATAKTYLKTQAKFIAILWAFIAIIIVAYFGFLTTPAMRRAEAPRDSPMAKPMKHGPARWPGMKRRMKSMMSSSTLMSIVPIDMPALSGMA